VTLPPTFYQGDQTLPKPTIAIQITTTSSPTPSLTPKPLPTLTPTTPQTLTPVPTLSEPEAKKLVIELLDSNAGCQFPCWWGIVPGQTTWPEAYHFLVSFVEITPYTPKSDQNGEPSKIITYLISYPLQNKEGRGGFNVHVENDQIVLIFVGVDSTIYNSQLHQILKKYGIPDEIYIRVIKDVPSDDLPFILVLSYDSNNFVVAYDMIAHADDNELISCPNGESPALWLWSPDEIVSEQRIQDWTLGVVPIIPLKPLEQVSELDLKSFTEIFSSTTDSGNCLSTSKNFWNIEP
jgi:hypothetical protein